MTWVSFHMLYISLFTLFFLEAGSNDALNTRLSGKRSFKVVVAELPGFLDLGSEGNRTIIRGGVDYEIFQMFLKTYGLRFDILEHPCTVYGSKSSNGSWDGAIGKLFRQEADMALPTFLVSYERMMDIDFSISFVFGQLKFIVKAPEKYRPLNAVLKPFDSQVWCIIIMSLLVNGAVMYLVLKAETRLHRRRLECSLSNVYWSLFGNILGKDDELILRKVNTFSVKCIFIIWWQVSLILGASYAGSIVSFMTYPSYTEVPRTFEELAEAIQANRYSCGTTGAAASYFTGAKSRAGKIIGKHLKENPSKLTVIETYKKVLRGNFAFVLGDNLVYPLEKEYGKGGHLASEDSYIIFSKGFPLRNGFPYKRQLDHLLRRVYESGLREKLMRSLSSKSVVGQDETIQPLMLQDLFSPFLVLGAGYLLSAVCLIGEILWQRKTLFHRS